MEVWRAAYSSLPFSLPIFPTSPLCQPPVCSLYLSICFWFCLFICFVLDSTYKWNHTVFVLLCLTYLFHLVLYPLGPSILSQMARFHGLSWFIHACVYLYMFRNVCWRLFVGLAMCCAGNKLWKTLVRTILKMEKLTRLGGGGVGKWVYIIHNHMANLNTAWNFTIYRSKVLYEHRRESVCVCVLWIYFLDDLVRNSI